VEAPTKTEDPLSTAPNVIPARFRFGRDPDAKLNSTAEVLVDDLALHRWYRARDRHRDLGRVELEALVDALAARPDLWRHLVRESPDHRYYVRLLLDEHVEIWLICWSPAQDTGFHDHAGSRGAVAVVAGAVTELLLGVRGSNPVRVHAHGGRFSFGASHIHDVQHAAGAPAASLHVYSPPLGEMGFYDVAEDGTLGRRSGDHQEEFC
jgi:predicted metal-dependent enzyme (double-stranded beta helix superfamily)